MYPAQYSSLLLLGYTVGIPPAPRTPAGYTAGSVHHLTPRVMTVIPALLCDTRWFIPVLKKVTWRSKSPETLRNLLNDKLIACQESFILSDSECHNPSRAVHNRLVDYSSPEQGLISRKRPPCFKPCFCKTCKTGTFNQKCQEC